jgi:hypothetical protein
MERIGGPKARQILWHSCNTLALFLKAEQATCATRHPHVLVRVGGDHVPPWQDFALNIDLDARAARRGGKDRRARVEEIRGGNIGLRQIEVIRGRPQPAVQKLELDAGLSALRTCRLARNTREDEPRARAEALRVVAVEGHPVLWPPQKAEARGHRLAYLLLIR